MEILLKNCHRSADIRIAGGDDNTLLTTIPRKNGEMIRFFPDEAFDVLHYNADSVYRFSVRFEDMQRLGEEFYYSYRIEDLEVSSNARQSSRQNVELPALMKDKSGNASFATVLDLSYRGMRAESDAPLSGRRLEVEFSDAGGVREAKADVMWARQVGSKWQYGLSLRWISN